MAICTIAQLCESRYDCLVCTLYKSLSVLGLLTSTAYKKVMFFVVISTQRYTSDLEPLEVTHTVNDQNQNLFILIYTMDAQWTTYTTYINTCQTFVQVRYFKV